METLNRGISTLPRGCISKSIALSILDRRIVSTRATGIKLCQKPGQKDHKLNNIHFCETDTHNTLFIFSGLHGWKIVIELGWKDKSLSDWTIPYIVQIQVFTKLLNDIFCLFISSKHQKAKKDFVIAAAGGWLVQETTRWLTQIEYRHLFCRNRPAFMFWWAD